VKGSSSLIVTAGDGCDGCDGCDGGCGDGCDGCGGCGCDGGGGSDGCDGCERGGDACADDGESGTLRDERRFGGGRGVAGGEAAETGVPSLLDVLDRVGGETQSLAPCSLARPFSVSSYAIDTALFIKFSVVGSRSGDTIREANELNSLQVKLFTFSSIFVSAKGMSFGVVNVSLCVLLPCLLN
jgi:hypothetical protein